MNETFFKGTYKLPPAHWFEYKDGQMHIERYWDADFRHKTSLTYEQAADEIDARVRESVAAHRISDVKLGSFLSGGVDSSYITACLMPDDTFSVGFESPDGTHKFDETTEAGELSQKLGIHNYREMLTKEQCLDAFADIQYHMDEPQSNPSSVPLYFLCQLARQHVTVVLSGEGADEIYAGYEWYADTPLMQKYKRLPAGVRHLASDVSQHLPYFKGHDFIIKGSGRPEDWFIGQAHVFEEKDAYDILKPKYRVGPTAREVAAPIYDRVKDLSELEKKQYLDLNLWLPGDILLKADKMSMAHSLELRVPYLDREVFREARDLPRGATSCAATPRLCCAPPPTRPCPMPGPTARRKASPCRLPSGWRIRNFPPRCARVLPATWPGNTLTRISCWPCWTTPGTSAARSGRPTPS